MKNKTLLRTNMAISTIIIVGFLIITLFNYYHYSELMENDIENITKLTSYTIYSHIDSELSKPVHIAQTMAAGTFLKEWLSDEPQRQDDEAYRLSLIDYLSSIKNKYQYDSAFLISYKSGVYYYTEGINKVMSPQNDHDKWYYIFLNSGRPYQLEIDTDEANLNQQTVFINCRMEDDDGSLLGVIGVGVKLDYLQQTIRKFNEEFTLKAYLIDSSGTVQIHEDADRIERSNLFDEKGPDLSKNAVLNNKDSMEICWLPQKMETTCLITRYIETLDWYLVIEKDISDVKNQLVLSSVYEFLVAFILLGLILILVTYIIRSYNRKLYRQALTDELTGLPGRKYFTGVSFEQLSKSNSLTKLFFILDVDGFRQFNDQKGHVLGDKVLVKIKDIMLEVLGGRNIIARWGGDEFIGIIFDSPENARDMLFQVSKKISEIKLSPDYRITVSIGGTVFREPKDMDLLVEQANSALFAARCSGNGKISLYHEI